MNRAALASLLLSCIPLLASPAAADADLGVQGGVFRDCSYCPELVPIPAGSFVMGSISIEDGRTDEEGPLRLVKLVRPFAMGRTEVTQVQWAAIMRGNPSHFANCGADCPVEEVSWDDVQRYLSRLSEKTGKHYRLPTEAEWEYACRAGGADLYCGGGDVGRVGWVRHNSARMSQPVGSKQANAWGLRDMSGNVFEWVEDCWNAGYEGAPTDGSAWSAGDARAASCAAAPGSVKRPSPGRLRAYALHPARATISSAFGWSGHCLDESSDFNFYIDRDANK